MSREIYLKFRKYVKDEGGQSETDSWSRDSTSTTWDFDRIVFYPQGCTERYPLDFDASPGEVLYAVVAVWSTGDSFGHDSGAGMEIICVYKTREKAEALKTKIESLEYDNNGYGKNGLTYETESGAVVKDGFVAWAGYFERLDYVTIVTT